MRQFIVISISLLLIIDVSLSAELVKGGDDKGLPIVIVSDRMISERKNNKITFIGNVVAKRGDMTVYSKVLEIYNDMEGKDRIIARDDVRIEQDGKYAIGQEAIFYEEEQKIVLTGNPKAWEDKNMITGAEMIFFINKDESIVNGSEKRKVKLTFYPKGDLVPKGRQEGE
ncbi:MAG: lipopolysaccharide transport periplasmic protein LptA [Nitrospinae bacterium]|nr:lipopolysaccharide transport periplasmic protein LptA [Nitrospinota bacterium]